MQIDWQAIGVLVAALAILGGMAWWVIRSVYALKVKLAEVDAKCAEVSRDLAEFKLYTNERCHGRELWLRETAELLHKVDKRQAAIATKLGVEIET